MIDPFVSPYINLGLCLLRWLWSYSQNKRHCLTHLFANQSQTAHFECHSPTYTFHSLCPCARVLNSFEFTRLCISGSHAGASVHSIGSSKLFEYYPMSESDRFNLLSRVALHQSCRNAAAQNVRNRSINRFPHPKTSTDRTQSSPNKVDTN